MSLSTAIDIITIWHLNGNNLLMFNLCTFLFVYMNILSRGLIQINVGNIVNIWEFHFVRTIKYCNKKLYGLCTVIADMMQWCYRTNRNKKRRIYFKISLYVFLYYQINKTSYYFHRFFPSLSPTSSFLLSLEFCSITSTKNTHSIHITPKTLTFSKTKTRFPMQKPTWISELTMHRFIFSFLRIRKRHTHVQLPSI